MNYGPTNINLLWTHLMIKRIGFACKWIDHPDQVNGIKPTDDAKQYNTGSTTVAWLNRQTREVAEQKLWDLMVGNIESTRKLIERIGTLNGNLRMVRISSDILPVYTQSDWSYFWRKPDVVSYCEQALGKVGELARMLMSAYLFTQVNSLYLQVIMTTLFTEV
jgi:UV DNA damage endonuclease